ncbi:MAG: hypothetical protein KDD74_13445 [Anaerolineales bacterium]|nr:hypothetical protein [Anaerolineales bacterium]
MQFSPSEKTRKTLLIAAITIIAYGLLLPLTGFYWDDWSFAWIAQFLGPADFIPAFMPFRPFLGPIFYFTTSIIPINPLAWQVFALFIRILIGIAAWWMFTQVFPQRKTLAYLASLLMLVYPGYSQHWVALTHINQELIPFIFYLFSFGYTFKALHTQKRADTLLALLLQICGIFPTEYFFGIEGVRFLLLLVILQGSFIERFAKSLKIWFPYLIIWMLNAAWIYFYYNFGPYASYEVEAAQTPNLIYFLTQALDALWKAGFYIWTQVLVLTFSSLPAPASILTLGLIAISFIFLLWALPRSAHTDKATENTQAYYLIFAGIFGILLGRLPSLAANLPLNLQTAYDRFMVSIMIGSTVFVIGVLELLIKNHKIRVIAFSTLIALGIGQQFFNANIFRRDWENQSEILWQLAWRAPGIEPNTVLLAHQMPLDYETDLNLAAPINWMYAPTYTRANLPYILLYTEKRLGGFTLPALEKDVDIHYPYRTVDFNGNLSNALVIYKNQTGCLQVLDPSRGDAEIYENTSDEFSQAVLLSNLSRIITNPAQPALVPFIPEPEPDWCAYFSKIELANQQENYAVAANLATEAQALGFTPEEPLEWTAFIEAYGMNGEIEKAVDASQTALKSERKTLKAVCVVWEQIQAKHPQEAGTTSAMLSLGCNH